MLQPEGSVVVLFCFLFFVCLVGWHLSFYYYILFFQLQENTGLKVINQLFRTLPSTKHLNIKHKRDKSLRHFQSHFIKEVVTQEVVTVFRYSGLIPRKTSWSAG